jgi:hypothetical protein
VRPGTGTRSLRLNRRSRSETGPGDRRRAVNVPAYPLSHGDSDSDAGRCRPGPGDRRDSRDRAWQSGHGRPGPPSGVASPGTVADCLLKPPGPQGAGARLRELTEGLRVSSLRELEYVTGSVKTVTLPLHESKMELSSIRAKCNGHNVMKATVCSVFTSEFTAYSFSVFSASQNWTIQKRYSDFRDLDTDLARKYPKRMQRVLRLPPKKILGKNNPSLVDFRQQALEAYLRSLVKDKGLLDTDEIREFLEIPLEAALSDLDSDHQDHIKGAHSNSIATTDASQAETSPRSQTLVMKVKSWQEEAEVKWGDSIGDLLSPSGDTWSELVSGDLLSPR